MTDLKIISGVAPFEGIFTKWYAWAEIKNGRSVDGPLRWFKWRAKLDIPAQEKKLRRLPFTDQVPRFDK